ncbi:MAG: phage portal protein [Chloroflexales bacterium]
MRKGFASQAPSRPAATRPTPSRGPQAFYDGVTGSSQAGGGGNKRRQAQIEQGHEEDRILTPIDRLRAAGLLRDALRNYGMHRSMIRQQRVNVVGPLGKLIVLADAENWGKQAQTWFNTQWAPQAEFRAGQSWGELLQLTIAQIADLGDCALAFDDGTITGGEGSGRILAFESDMIANLDERAFTERFPKGYTQVAGIIRDPYGREIGAVVSNVRGSTCLAAADALVLTRNPLEPRTATWWTFVKRQYRLCQIRGVGDGLTAVPMTLDAYEMLSKELQSAKRNASLAALVQRKVPDVDLNDPRLDPNATAAADQIGTASETVGENGGPEKDEPENYERLEALTGGMTEYLDAEDNVTFPDTGRPNVNMPAFIDFVTDISGSAFGLAHAYSRMKADSSYTSFRGDMIMTWVSFRDNQKFLERHVADWGAVQAISWAIATGKLPPPPEVLKDSWQGMLAWQWPRMPEVNEVDAQTALTAKLKNGATTLSAELGPAWKEILGQLALEVEEARRLNLPLSIFETKAGAPDMGKAAAKDPGKTTV